MSSSVSHLAAPILAAASDRAVRAIPPAWPLASSVAVNPFLGQAGEPLWTAAARLERVAGCAITMPRAWYRERVAAGAITDDDLAHALATAPRALRPADLAHLKAAMHEEPRAPQALSTIADLAGIASGTAWPDLVADRLGAWAAAWFDEGQALWADTRTQGAYAAWRAGAQADRTPEIAGLAGFRRHVAELPAEAEACIGVAAERLGLNAAALEAYFHRLLMDWGGWAQLARQRLWQAELSGGTDTTARDMLAIRIAFELALFERNEAAIADPWSRTIARYGAPVMPLADHVLDAILQEAADRSAQRRLAETLAGSAAPVQGDRPLLQAAFCIDVRSEVFRRALESVAPQAQTLGFAGFFGLAVSHRGFASDTREARLPVLLSPSAFSCSAGPTTAEADHAARIAARAKRAWDRFKRAAVSSFAFVEAAGVLSAGSLAAESLHAAALPFPKGPAPRLEPLPDVPARVDGAERILRGLSLTDGFARLVLLLGHGARVANNPHASALQCGACGGHSGEINARLVASLLNDHQVRAGLSERGILVPGDTLFVAGLHDTTSDEVLLYAEDHAHAAHVEDLARAEAWLAQAGRLARAERALTLPRAGGGEELRRRGRDWAQTRPEWGLAGCHAFVAAPRARTRGKALNGRAFLHDYDWRSDKGFAVLELILTAPVVVASWISLQYYGSLVAPDVFGAGDKLLHNVTGGVGVVEGNGGLMRAGLPWQSVHDGERPIHEPVRLTVCVEAPAAAMTTVLRRHDSVRALFDNRWLHLVALDEEGRPAQRYAGSLAWEPFDEHASLRLAS